VHHDHIRRHHPLELGHHAVSRICNKVKCEQVKLSQTDRIEIKWKEEGKKRKKGKHVSTETTFKRVVEHMVNKNEQQIAFQSTKHTTGPIEPKKKNEQIKKTTQKHTHVAKTPTPSNFLRLQTPHYSTTEIEN
jgi:hypothetical protein